MAANINQNYGQFYRGTEQIPSYGSGRGKKDTIVRYEFNTTDEKGNKVMDKMTKEESFYMMNEIASAYGDNVIVEFSGDALTALDGQGKGLYKGAEKQRAIEVESLEGAHVLTEEEIEAIKGSGVGDDMLVIMRDVDADAYKEYQRISKEGIALGTKEGMTAGFRYEIDWITKKAKENSNWLEEYKEAKKAETDAVAKSSESKLSAKAAAFLEKLRKTYGDFDFIVGNAGDDLRSLMKNSGKEFSVIFSSEELEKMASDEKYAEEKMNTVKGAVRMCKQINEQFGFGVLDNDAESGSIITKLAISFNEDGSVSYFAELEKISENQKEYIEKLKEKRVEDKKEATKKEKKAKDRKAEEKKARELKELAAANRIIIKASSEEDLIEKLKQVGWSETKAEKMQESGSNFDYSV